MIRLNEKELNKIGTLLVASYISIPLFNQIIRTVFPSLYIMSKMYLFGIILLILIIFLKLILQTKYKGINKYNFIFTLYIVFMLLISLLSQKSASTSTTIVSYVIVPLLSGMIIKLDAAKLIKYLLIFSTLLLLVSNKIIIVDSNGYISMGLSYIYMIPIVASIIYIMVLIKHENKEQKYFFGILSFLQLSILLKLLQYGSRGPILSIIIVVIFLSIVKWDYNKNQIIFKGTKITLWLVVLFLFVLNIDFILQFIGEVLEKMSISSQLIEKTIRLSKTQSVLNGRNKIYSIGWDGFVSRPIFGHGVSSFEYYTGIIYPHNFILQFLFDGGILLFIIMFSIILRGVNRMKIDVNQYLIFSLLFFISVPGAMLSGDIWRNTEFWLYIGFSISSLHRN
ncbi:O-antigen ligase family protein [Anaerorhabdus sp.]|uniref:O-antigen ligase family protein n=1 Tax=Anaerorhabdus sp. TaxID=1872524 RepID=UPI002FCBBC9B